MSRAGVERELAGGHREVEEEVVVAADEAQRLGDVRLSNPASDPAADHRRGEVAQQHQRAGAVAVVGLVAHLQHLGEDAGDVDAASVAADGAPAAAGRARRPSSAAGSSTSGE